MGQSVLNWSGGTKIEKRAREQFAHGKLPDRLELATVRHEYLRFRSVFGQKLAARTARHWTPRDPGNDSDGNEILFPARERFEKSHTFGAAGKAVARAFHIRTSDDLARAREQRHADLEFGIRRNSAFARLIGRANQFFEFDFRFQSVPGLLAIIVFRKASQNSSAATPPLF